MEILVTELSRYAIVLIMALYTYWGFLAFAAKKKKRIKLFKKQRFLLYVFHFLGHFILYLNNPDFLLIGLYASELVFFIFSNFIYKKIYGRNNRPIFNQIHMLLAISLVMLARLNVDSAKKQFVYAVAGMTVCMILPWLLEHMKNLEKEGWFYAVLGLIILLVVLFFGKEKYGAKNWLNVGPVILQPSEFVKILYVFAFASILSQEETLNFKKVKTISIMAAAFVLVLVLEKDLGAASIFFISYLFMLYCATGKERYLFAGGSAGAVAATVAYFLFRHVRTRVIAWKDPWSHIDNQGYQVAQSLFAIGTGGWFGMGLLQGLPNSVPIRESDFIFSAIAEELGGLFAIFLILVYIHCFICFISISAKVKNRFYKLTGIGFSVMMMFQTFLTLGGVTKFIPSTGVTLPLVSYGGSSVLSVIVIFCTMASIDKIGDKELREENEQEKDVQQGDENGN